MRESFDPFISEPRLYYYSVIVEHRTRKSIDAFARPGLLSISRKDNSLKKRRFYAEFHVIGILFLEKKLYTYFARKHSC